MSTEDLLSTTDAEAMPAILAPSALSRKLTQTFAQLDLITLVGKGCRESCRQFRGAQVGYGEVLGGAPVRRAAS